MLRGHALSGVSSKGFLLENSRVVEPPEVSCGCRVSKPHEAPYLAQAPMRGLGVASTPCRDARMHGLEGARMPVSSFESVPRGLRSQSWGSKVLVGCGRGRAQVHTLYPAPAHEEL